jgi:class 3 adenylate cyclase
MDDKGSTLICIWGLTPMAHDDDAARAILTGINMNKELKKIEGTQCKIGITSGEMFSGVVGTSGGRKEFSVLGDVANLSARIMGGGKMGQINCDMNTRNLASNTFSFIYKDHTDYKGKSISIPTFAPVWPQEEQKEIKEKALPVSTYLKIWTNPMFIERSSAVKS